MSRLLVMIPAGAVYDRDCVRWYHPTVDSLDHYHNIGDAFVYDSSLKLLDFESLGALRIADPPHGYADDVNAACDHVILRGSNYLHAHMRWGRAAELLPKLRVPIIAFGVGAQAPRNGKVVLSDESVRIWRMIADSTESVGVRGAYTAEVLWDIGVRNTRIIGCPTLFRHRNPDLSVHLPPLGSIRDVGVSLRREVSMGYATDISRYLRAHRDLIRDMDARFDVELLAQGEVEEKQIIFGDDAQREAAFAKLADPKGHVGQHFLDSVVEDLYRRRLYYSDAVEDFDARVATKQLVLGFRLHGNLMALAQGIPSIYFTYDSRTAEFAETFAIPRHDVDIDGPFDLDTAWDLRAFERFNMTYQQRYRDMRDFLAENGLPHRLPPPGARVVERPGAGASAADAAE